jgi:hypothetical protein
MKRLDKEQFVKTNIHVVDISRSGLGFFCDEPLLIGSVYEAVLNIWSGEKLHCFLRITRVNITTDSNYYGALFIGMTETDAARIDIFQTLFDTPAPV